MVLAAERASSFFSFLSRPAVTLGSVKGQRLVEPSKQLKEIIQIELNIVKNPNWLEANQLAIFKRGRNKSSFISAMLSLRLSVCILVAPLAIAPQLT